MADLPAWVFASLCLIGFLLFAGYNGFIAWRQFVLSEPAPSFGPVFGGCLGVGAILAAPFGAWTDRLPYILIPLVLAFAHIPTGPTTTGGFNKDVDEVKITLTNTVPTMVTVEDERQPGALLLADPRSCPDT